MKGNEQISETSHFATSMILGRKALHLPRPHGRRSCCQAEADKKRRKEEEHRLQLQREEEARRARLEEERLLESMKFLGSINTSTLGS